MARGGYRVGAGRPKKAPNAANPSKAQESQSAQDGGDLILAESKAPLEYMLAVMNDPNVDNARRDRMAIAAAPFVHGKAGDLGKKEEKNNAAKKVGGGKFGASAPPRLVVDNTTRVN